MSSPALRPIAADKPKRVITLARKEQNRAAQKVYRQRKREKRQRLRDETLQHEGRQVELRPYPVETSSEFPTGTLDMIDTLHIPDLGLLQDSGYMESGSDNSEILNTMFENDPLFPWQFLSTTGDPALHDESSTTISRTNPLFTKSDLLLQGDIPSLEQLDQIPLSPSIQNKTLNTIGVESQTSATVSTLPSSTTASYNLLVPPPCHALSEPVHTTIFAAALENAVSLGFDLRKLATKCGSDSFYMSPFYRPDATPQDGPDILLSTALECATLASSSVPASLHPTLAQILIPHHASLDLIPLPRFRDSAIMLAAALPQFFNLWELKLDIYVRGALVVDRRPCAPWDDASWRAAPWFLKKWKMALRSEDELSSLPDF